MYRLIKFAIGPFALVFGWWFNFVLVPQLPMDMQAQINDGGLGMMLGLLGTACIWVCCTVSWYSLDEWRKERRKCSPSNN